MLTVSQLGKKFGISRSGILYYEREGILQPKKRSDNGYRWYGCDEMDRLEKILAYRSFGIPVAQLPTLLDKMVKEDQKYILTNQFNALEREIQNLRLQQKAIVQFMEQPELIEERIITKARWTQIMRDAGLSDEQMRNWHIQFEKTDSSGHLKFLESLSLEPEEIQDIINWARQ